MAIADRIETYEEGDEDHTQSLAALIRRAQKEAEAGAVVVGG